MGDFFLSAKNRAVENAQVTEPGLGRNLGNKDIADSSIFKKGKIIDTRNDAHFRAARRTQSFLAYRGLGAEFNDPFTRQSGAVVLISPDRPRAPDCAVFKAEDFVNHDRRTAMGKNRFDRGKIRHGSFFPEAKGLSKQ
jgi:hypothetical protein